MSTKKRARNKFLCILLTVTMLLSLMPASAFAESEYGGTAAEQSDEGGKETVVNGFAENISLKVYGCLAEKAEYKFSKDTAEYNISMADSDYNKMFGTTGMTIKIADNKVPATGDVPSLYCKVYKDGEACQISSKTDPQPLKSKENTLTVKGMCDIPVGGKSIIKVQIGEIDENKNFTVSDTYTYNITNDKLMLNRLALSECGENGSSLSLSPSPALTTIAPKKYIEEYVATSRADKIKIGYSVWTKEAKVFIDGEEYESDSEIDVSKFEIEGESLAKIPMVLKYDHDGKSLSREYTLVIDRTDRYPIITSQPEDMTIDKGSQQLLSVEAEPVDGGNLTYEWYGESVTSGIVSVLKGETGSTCKPQSEYASELEYYCIVTNTVNGKEYKQRTNSAMVKVNLTELTAPKIKNAPQVTGGSNFFQGEQLNFTVNVDVKQVREEINGTITNLRYPIEDVPYKVELYKNDENSTEGGEKVETYDISTGKIGTAESYGTYKITTAPQWEPGDWYYYAVVTVSKNGYESKSSTSPTRKVNITDVSTIVTELKGEGTEDSPYLIEDVDDLNYVKDLVEGKTDGQVDRTKKPYTFIGRVLAFENDIELPESWEPIGCLKTGTTAENEGKNILPFSGTIDGKGHTLTVPDGGKPLLNYVRRATVKNLNLYGTHIRGYGLVDKYVVDYEGVTDYMLRTAPTITIDNVTIKEGTKILKAGFIGGYASGQDKVFISNCTAEKGVIIGDDGSWGDLGDTTWEYGFIENGLLDHKDCIGTFAGAFNGTITNCTSYATVYGRNNVGGIVGMKGQSMGLFEVKNCAFLGEVIATGEKVGGIVGAGYIAGSAPLSPPVEVKNCYVNGSVSGKNEVGGIIGSDRGVFNYNRVNGGNSDMISANYFYGKIDSDGEMVGGIIGSLQDFSMTEGTAFNYYLDSCGADNAIGGVVTGTVSGEEKHSLAMNAEDFADGTALKALNKALNSYKNWIQTENDKQPVLSKDNIVLYLETSGVWKTEYYIGDELDLSGLELYANWSDGKRTKLDIEDVTITGYDKTKRGVQTVTLEYGIAKVEIEVTVLKKATGTINVYVSVLGDTKHGEGGTVHTLKDGNLEKWVENKGFEVDVNATVWDVLQQAAKENGKLSFTNPSGGYITAVTYNGVTLAEIDNGNNSGWMYTLNGAHPDLSVDQQYLEEGDVIVFHYTDDYTKEDWNSGVTVSEVIKMIDALPAAEDLDLSYAAAVAEAQDAFNALSDEDKALVSELKQQKLEAAVLKIAELKKEAASTIEEAFSATGAYVTSLIKGNETFGSEWTILGLARAGRLSEETKEAYYKNIVEYVKANGSAVLSKNKPTENERLVLALTAIGKDVTNVAGYNLLEPLSNLDWVNKQGINSTAFALLAFDSHNYEIPKATEGTQTTRENLIKTILDAQLADGGWDLSAENSDPDMTAMVLQALAPYYGTNAEVKSAVDEALKCLSDLQNSDGGYASWGTTNSESCAQVITALTALGIDPDNDSRFVKNGNSVVDAFLSFYVEGGGFAHVAGGGVNGMATEQGYYTLAAYSRWVNGQTSLYDMSDVEIEAGGNTDSGDNTGEEPAAKPDTGNVPKTGDTSDMLPWLALVLLGGAGAMALRRREDKDQEAA